MGKHINPGNEAFKEALQTYYVDKTGMIALINRTINTKMKLTCISRPRRFGKSYAVQMLCAYYDCQCDSHGLFDKYAVSQSVDYETHINQYKVLTFDVTNFISTVKRTNGQLSDVPDMIAADLRSDIVRAYPQLADIPRLEDCLLECVNLTGRKFVFIIDEWDALIREAKHDHVTQEAYLNLLRGLFKNNDVTPYVVAAAYMTGILPIKKDGSQSAISDFREYSVLNPGSFAEYVGFTEAEVKTICQQYDMDFDEAKKWYDGYSFDTVQSIYNPYSVMLAMEMKAYEPYWRQTSAADSLVTFINMDFDGLQEDIMRLSAGESLIVNTSGFQNDVETFNSKNDVLTLLIHLGYLAYDRLSKRVRIPNEEIRNEFIAILQNVRGNSKLAGLVRASEKLLSNTLSGNADEVVKAIEKIRESQYAPNFYNNEQALRYVIKFAYIVCVDKYMQVEELPSGKGIADVVYIPYKETPAPALVIELKWNKSSDAAISQIKDKNYPAVLENYGGEIVLVGINYDDASKSHSCTIEKINKI